MELLEYFRIIKKRLLMMLAVTVIAALTSALFSLFIISPVYEAKATLFIGRAPSTVSDQSRYNDILMYQKLVKTYAELAKSRIVIDETLSSLKLNMTYEMLQNRLKVTPKGDTQIIEVAIQDESAERAFELTNTLINLFVEKINTIINSDDVKIIDKAQLPDKPVSPRVILNTIIVAVLAFLSSLIFVFLIEYLDNTLKTEEDVEEQLGMTVLASIPFIKET